MSAIAHKSPHDLHVRVIGEGEALVMLHGWGMHSAMLEDVAQALAQQYQVYLVDLPGHGQSPAGTFTLNSISEALASVVNRPAHWLGWSLGGSIAMQLALRFPGKVRSLILVSATPRFVRSEEWSCAVEAAVLQQFADDLAYDYAATMKRFLLLQTLGSEQARTGFKQLQQHLQAVEAPDSLALESGLAILRDSDLRKELAQIQVPVQIILGEKDTLVPQGVHAFYRESLPQVHVEIIPGAGHVSFVSHRELFLQTLHRYLKEIAAA